MGRSRFCQENTRAWNSSDSVAKTLVFGKVPIASGASAGSENKGLRLLIMLTNQMGPACNFRLGRLFLSHSDQKRCLAKGPPFSIFFENQRKSEKSAYRGYHNLEIFFSAEAHPPGTKQTRGRHFAQRIELRFCSETPTAHR